MNSDMSTVSTRIPRYCSKNAWSTIEPAMPIETPPSDRYDLPRMVAAARPGPREPEELLLHVGRDGRVAGILHVAPVDAEGGQALLAVAGEHCREIDGARALGAVEAPDRLGHERVHVHRLGAVAPAGRDGERDARRPRARTSRRTWPPRTRRRCRCRRSRTRRVARRDSGGSRMRSAVARAIAALVLQRLAHAALSPVDGGADADRLAIRRRTGRMYRCWPCGCLSDSLWVARADRPAHDREVSRAIPRRS